MSDVFSGITSHLLCADLLTYHSSCSDLGCAAVFLLHKSDNIGVDLGKHKGSIVLEGKLAFFDGLDRDGATAVHP